MKVKNYTIKEESSYFMVYQRSEYRISKPFKTRQEAEKFIKTNTEEDDFLYLDDEVVCTVCGNKMK